MSTSSTEHRRLSAIMFTDMVGYSALSQRNEALALELLEEHREVLRSVFPRHQGHEIKSTGDGFLVEFASALAAVHCALEIQRLMRQRNENRSAERRVLIRIGIHLGDVVRRDNDVFGDGVNIAARIEPLAEPGGICVSRAVYEQIENKVEHALVQLSRPALKNIQATVEVYRLLLDEPRASRPPTPRRQPRRWLGVIVVAAVAMLISGAAYWQFRSRLPSLPAAGNPIPQIGPVKTAGLQAPLPVARLQVLHSFGPTNTEGVNGWGAVFLAADGFIYGTTVNQGPGGGGSVYRVRTDGADYAVLHSLQRTNDGAEPTGGVIVARDGALYGTTFRGGTNDSGTVFRLGTDGRGFQVLHHFAASNDCRHPQSELLEARDGSIYGTATGGGGHGRGGIFKIAPDGLRYSVVSRLFHGRPDDPRRPVGGLIQGIDGALYGTTKFGGLKDNGTVFRLDPGGDFTVVKSLGLASGGLLQPEGTLLQTTDGALYGTSTLGGVAGGGGLFRMTADGGDFAIIHSFGTQVDDARQPSAGLILSDQGTLIGTTFAGGVANLGAVFRLNRDGSQYEMLHQFTGGFSDGIRSRSRLTPGTPDSFYSATLGGGANNLGTVFRLTILNGPASAETQSHAH